MNTNFSTQQLSIRQLEAGQTRTTSTLVTIDDKLNRLFDMLDRPPQATQNVPPANNVPANNNVNISDLLSLEDSADTSLPPPLSDDANEDADSVSLVPNRHHKTQRDVSPTAIPIQHNTPSVAPSMENNANGMMPVQFVRVSDLDVFNTRISELVFPTFNPYTDLFHVWQGAALRKVNNHYRLGGYVTAQEYGRLTLDEFMPLLEQAILVDSLKDALSNWFWDLHVPGKWELRNKGVDIWNQLILEHGLIASSTAEQEQILTEWEQFEGSPDEDMEVFRSRFSRKCSQSESKCCYCGRSPRCPQIPSCLCNVTQR